MAPLKSKPDLSSRCCCCAATRCRTTKNGSKKLDGYRALAIKTDGHVHLRSRNNKDFSVRYPAIAKALAALPNDTVIDGEIVAFDESGRPSFNALQNYGSSRTPIFLYVFDVLVLAGRNVISEPLDKRRKLL